MSDVFKLSSECVDEVGKLKPMEATYQGIPGHDHEWDDFGPSGADRFVALIRDFRKRLHALPKTKDRWERLASRVMDDHLQLKEDWYADKNHWVDLNNIASSFQNIRQVFDVMDTTTKRGWESIAARLETIDRATRSYQASLEEGRVNGETVAKRQVHAAITEGKVNAGDQSFFGTLPQTARKTGMPVEIADQLERAADKAKKAYADMVEYFEKTYMPSAREKDGVGRERYVKQLKMYLGTEIDLDETYAWGWSQVREIGAEMERLAKEIKPGASLQEVIELLKTDPMRSAQSPEEFRRMMLDRQLRALEKLDGLHFDVPEKVKKIDVKLTPPGGALAAYYIPPTEDFSRIGTVWYPTGGKQTFPIWDEISTAYHEGFPGHHLQCGTQVALSSQLSRLHRLMVWYPGYGEGWALYAEQLMNELGYFEKPEYVLGMHAAQMLRACRVCIDIGVHLDLTIPKDQPFHPGEKWTFETAVEMLETKAFSHPDWARSEITRYFGWPAQAISYKVGQRHILALREELKQKQGHQFTLKDFHRRVVGSGPVGLKLLRDLVLET